MVEFSYKRKWVEDKKRWFDDEENHFGIKPDIIHKQTDMLSSPEDALNFIIDLKRIAKRYEKGVDEEHVALDLVEIGLADLKPETIDQILSLI
ncbi:MAG: hypothetical protein WCK01_03130 [Candidatus Uhrbacteria bacterium]